MSEFICPLCGSRHSTNDQPFDLANDPLFDLANDIDACRQESSEDLSYDFYYCHHYGVHFAIEHLFAEYSCGEIIEHALNLIVEHLIRQKYCTVDGEQRTWHFYYDADSADKRDERPEYVNLAVKMRDYPIQAIDVAHRTLLNLAARFPNLGQDFDFWSYNRRLGFVLDSAGDIMSLLTDLQYVKYNGYKRFTYTITALGWQKIDELRKQEQTVRQGFIAMAFKEEAKPIRESFRTAIKRAGYDPVILDEKEHNNQIVPEIFYEIQRSKFVVVDVTYPNYGAYYEAGYAQALGKQVIICCREDVYQDSTKQPHFDIAQQSIIVWKDHEDLVRRLKRRIEVTVQ